MSEFKVFTSAELSNDEYHDPESWCAQYFSGSVLAEVYAGCPAGMKFAKRKAGKALQFGTQSHTNFESRELFERQYRRAPAPEDYKVLITSQAALAAKIKSWGIPGTSGKGYPELLKMMCDAGQDLNVLWLIEMIAESQARADGVELIKAEDYDACVAMRSVLESIPEHNACMNSPTAQRELSIFGVVNGVKVKVRIDHIDIVKNYRMQVRTGVWVDGVPEMEWVTYPEVVVITDYKTTMSANPKEFGKLCANHHYLLKMSLQHDLFVNAYPGDKRPVIVRLLAQEKSEPYLPMAFRFNDEHLRIGRRQYLSVLNTLEICNRLDVWPAYENGAAEVELQLPEWFLKQNRTNS